MSWKLGFWCGLVGVGAWVGVKAFSTSIVTAIKYKNILVWLLLFAGFFLVSRVRRTVCDLLTLIALGKFFRRYWNTILIFSQKTSCFYISCKLSAYILISIGDNYMNCQNLFSGENKKNFTNLSSAELAKRVVKVNSECNSLNPSFFFLMKTNFPTKKINRSVRKRIFGHVRPARIQIRLRIRAVWSESSLGAFWRAKDAVSSCG